MTKKIFLLLFALCQLAWLPTAAAETVVAEGMGLDRNAAIKDAARKAVMEVVGLHINTKSLVSDAQTEYDHILAASQGFVRKVKILEEEKTSYGVRIKAQMDVSDEPNTELMDRLSTVLLMNDPRIAVAVFSGSGAGSSQSLAVPAEAAEESAADSSEDAGDKSSDESSEDTAEAGAEVEPEPIVAAASISPTGLSHDRAAETALCDRLLSVGFTHVTIAPNIQDARTIAIDQSINADYLVLGYTTASSMEISVPDEKQRSTKTGLFSGRAKMDVKVFNTRNGELAGVFNIAGSGVDAATDRAQDKAKDNAAAKAADELENLFKKFTSRRAGSL